MSISYNGIGHLAVTIPASGCAEGTVCKVDTRGIALSCDAGDKFCGVVHTMENDMAAVIVEGFVTVSYTGTAPICGWVGLSADGNGGVKVDTAGICRLVMAVNSTDMTVTFKL